MEPHIDWEIYQGIHEIHMGDHVVYKGIHEIYKANQSSIGIRGIYKVVHVI